jgi:diguanylate cyclase (GGDEF)-like protein
VLAVARRAWPDELPRAIERARRSRTPLSVAMLDLDRFKEFNDEFGHPASDKLLQTASAAWLWEMRDSDLDPLARTLG